MINKKIKAIMFDLDGTLLPMNEDEFTHGYFGLLCKKLMPFGYEKDKLIQTIWQGTKAMIKNDGKETNEKVFWDIFKSVYGDDHLKDKEYIDQFYLSEFKNAKVFCGENDLAKQIVDLAKLKGLKVILASNPVFPKNGMTTRMSFIGLNEQDFDYISSYENSHFSKPNPNYYKEILHKNNLNPDEVVFFGNNEVEDLDPAKFCGIETFLIGNCVKLKDEKSNTKTLTYNDVIEKIKAINS